MKKIVVTGASGFVGRHLLTRLLRDRMAVVALSRRGTGRGDVQDITLPDLLDAQSLAPHMAGATAVVHLAARAHQSGPEPADAAALYDQANVGSALAVARAARAAGVPRLVLMSSIGVNGNHTKGRPFSEADTPRPAEPYAISKWQAEQAVAAELGAGPTDFCVLRPPLVYGDGCPGNFARLLALAERAPLIPLGGVSARRSFISVTNLSDAICMACTHPAAARRTFVVTDAQALSLAELMRCLTAAMGRSQRVVVNVPPGWLAITARAVGHGATWAKLTAELLVDGSAFCRATGWAQPVQAWTGLAETARGYHQSHQQVSR